MHKFVVGVAPVRSLCRVGWAVGQLLSIPADQLRNTTISNGSSNSDVSLSRQLRRGVTSLARAVTIEALGAGASVAGGADYVLRGGSGQGSEHPAGWHPTLCLFVTGKSFDAGCFMLSLKSMQVGNLLCWICCTVCISNTEQQPLYLKLSPPLMDTLQFFPLDALAVVTQPYVVLPTCLQMLRRVAADNILMCL